MKFCPEYIDIRVYTCYNIFKLRKEENAMPMTAKQMIRYLQQNGFEIVGQRGSHVKLRNNTIKQVIVPNHAKDLKKGLEQEILKQAGLK